MLFSTLREMTHLRSYIILITAVCFLGSCWEFSPNQVFDNDTPVDLNAKNLENLYAAAKDDTIVIAFVGDSQRFYDEFEDFVDKANEIESIDFVILAGDITDFGLLEEFELIQEDLAELNKPYIGVIGNHDVLAHGEEVFERMFGPLNFSFVYDSVKFVVHNTNSREYPTGDVPDLTWLAHELTPGDSVRYYIGVSHIPPFSPDFDKGLETSYANLLASTPGFLVSLHGHIHEHKDAYPYEDGIRYITSYSFEQKSFVLLKIASGNIEKIIVEY
jgi:3',5'-cyclic AMP phosphodiesterase CpdA